MNKKKEELLIETANQLGFREAKKEIKFNTTEEVYQLTRVIAEKAEKRLEENPEKYYVAVINHLINSTIKEG